MELLEGDLVLVSPQGPLQAAQLNELHARLAAAYHGVGHIRNQSPLDLRPHNLPEPDLAVIKGDVRDYRERHPSGKDTLLVIELAQTSQNLDRRKAAIYAAAGIPTYWLIDLSQGSIEVHTGASDLGGYQRRVVLGRDEQVEVPGLGVHWPVADLVG